MLLGKTFLLILVLSVRDAYWWKGTLALNSGRVSPPGLTLPHVTGNFYSPEA